MRPLDLFALVIYVAGAIVYGTIAAGALRTALRRDEGRGGRDERTRADDAVFSALTFVGTGWFLACGLLVIGGARPGTRLWPIHLAAFVLANCFPPLIAHGAWLDARAGARRRGEPQPARARGAVALGLYFATAATIAFGIAGFAGKLQLRGSTVGLVVQAVFTVSLVLALIYAANTGSRYPPPEPTGRGGWRAALYVSGAVAAVGGTLVLLRKAPAADLAELLLRSMPLFLMLAGTWFENRFEFYDLFVKRGVALIADTVIVGASLAIALPLLRGLDLGAATPLAHAVALLPALALLPAVHARTGRALDAWWLGRRYGRDEALRILLDGVRSATSEEELTTTAAGALKTIFAAPVQVSLDGSAPHFEIRAEAAVPATDGPSGVVRLGARASDAPYLSEDHATLTVAAWMIGNMLANVRQQRRRHEQEAAAGELQLQASRSELKALRAQVNPHFLFNALNAIAGWIHKDPARADRTVERLADVFRYVLRGSDREWARLGEEVDFARAYLDVEQARFGARLNVEVDCPADAARLQVPALLLQTLVDNAVKHGIARRRAGGTLGIAIRLDAVRVVIDVSNDPPDDDAPPVANGEGFGLHSVRERLRNHFGDAASVDLVRAGGRIVARVLLPAVDECEDGDAALAFLARDPADLVFLDIEMPGASGLAVAERMPAPQPSLVFCTAYDRFAVEAFEREARDYLLKPVAPARLARALDRVRLARGETPRLVREAEAARALQIRRRRDVAPAGLDVHAVTLAAREVSGDFDDVVETAAGAIVLAVGDVGGKGIDAGLLAAGLQASIRAAAARGAVPGAIIDEAAAWFDRSAEPNRLATLVVARWDPGARTLDWAGAGHPAALVVGPAGEVRARLESERPVIGVPCGRPMAAGTIRLAAGEAVLVFSDGMVDVEDPSGSAFGEAGVAAAAAGPFASARDLAARILDAARAHRGPVPLPDDLTLLAVRVR